MTTPITDATAVRRIQIATERVARLEAEGVPWNYLVGSKQAIFEMQQGRTRDAASQ